MTGKTAPNHTGTILTKGISLLTEDLTLSLAQTGTLALLCYMTEIGVVAARKTFVVLPIGLGVLGKDPVVMMTAHPIVAQRKWNTDPSFHGEMAALKLERSRNPNDRRCGHRL